MVNYTYSGLLREGSIVSAHVFRPCNGGKPVIAMKSSIYINGRNLQKVSVKAARKKLFQCITFSVSNIHKTSQKYDYATSVQNLENTVEQEVSYMLKSCMSYYGMIIDYSQADNCYTVGCGPNVFGKVACNTVLTPQHAATTACVHITTSTGLKITNITVYSQPDAAVSSALNDNSHLTLPNIDLIVPLLKYTDNSLKDSATSAPRTAQLTPTLMVAPEVSVGSSCHGRNSSSSYSACDLAPKLSSKTIPETTPTPEILNSRQTSDSIAQDHHSIDDLEYYRPTIPKEERENKLDELITITVGTTLFNF